MTTPSIIYDQERIELLKSKAELAGTMLEQGLVPLIGFIIISITLVKINMMNIEI